MPCVARTAGALLLCRRGRRGLTGYRPLARRPRFARALLATRAESGRPAAARSRFAGPGPEARQVWWASTGAGCTGAIASVIDGPTGPTAAGWLMAAPLGDALPFCPKWVNVGGPPWGLTVCINVDAETGDSVIGMWNRPGVCGGGVIQTVPRFGVPLFRGVSFEVTDGGSKGVIGSDVNPLATESPVFESEMLVVTCERLATRSSSGICDWRELTSPTACVTTLVAPPA